MKYVVEQIKNLNLFKALLLSFILVNVISVISSKAYAGPARTTYQAKIVRPDGYPLEAASVNFKFTILDPAGACILYSETYSSVNMVSTGGLISFALGSGVKTYPVSATTFEQVFSNITPALSCDTGGPSTYVPAAVDARKIVMQFHDGNGWQTLPAMTINAVPYAMYANQASNLNGKTDTDFVQVANLVTCGINEALHYNGAGFTCVSFPTAETVSAAAVVSALGYTPATGASVTALTSSLSTTDAGLASVSSSVFSVSSTVSSLSNSVSTLQSAVAASFATITSSQWVTSGTNISYDLGSIAVSGTVRIGIDTTTCSAGSAGTLRYNAGVVEYCNGISWEAFGVAGAGINLINGSASGTQTFVTGISGNNFNITSSNGVHSFNIPFAASASVTAGLLSNTDYVLFSNKVNATSASVVSALGFTPANVANNLSDLTNVSTARTNLGLGGFATASSLDLGSASATGIISDARLPSFANITSGSQYTKVTVDGKGRVTSGALLDSSDVTTALSYTPANSATVTTAINTKITSSAASVAEVLGYVPAASGAVGVGTLLASNNLSDVASATLSRTNLGLGLLSTLNFLDLSSSFASGTLAVARLPSFIGDATTSAGSNTIILSNSGVIAGTYTKVTVDVKGRVTSGGQLSVTDVTTALGYTPASATASSQWLTSGSTISYSSGNVGIGTTGPASLLDLQKSSTATSLAAGLPSARIINTSATQGDGSTTSNAAQFKAEAGNGAVSIQMMATNDTGAYGTAGVLKTGTNHPLIFAPNSVEKMRISTAGNVGIGISAPVTRLDVAGAIRISMDSATCAVSYAGTLRYNAGSLEMCNGTAWSAFGLAAAGVNSLNGSTSQTQTFANSLTGTTPAFASLNGVHTLNIPLASAGSVAAGLISNADYVTFSNKITSSAASVAQALGYVPASATALNNYLLRSNNLSDLTSSASARTNLGLGGFATVSSLDLSSASATGTIALARLPAAANVTSGTQYTKVTVDGYGRVTSGGQISVTDVTTALGYTPVSAAAASQWNTSGTTINYMNGNVGIGTTVPGSLLDVSGTLNATSLRIGGNSVMSRVGQKLQIGDIANNGITLGLLTSGTERLSINSSGNVGIGTTNPIRKLQVVGASSSGDGISIEDTTSPYLLIRRDGLNEWYTVAASTTNTLEFRSGNLANTSTLALNNANSFVGIGTNTPVTRLEVSGGLRISMESATCAVSYAGTLRYNAGSLEMCNGTAWSAFGLASAGLNSLNGSTSATQTFANSLTGTAPAFLTANGVHTLNIPLASAGSVTAGLISNADYISFSNKITSSAASVAQALGYVPASATALNNYLLRSNNLSDLTNASTARTNLGLGGFATVSSLDLSSASATGTIALARLPAAANVTSGTQYTKVTVDGYGRVTSGGQISVTDVTTALGYTPASATAATQWNTSGTTINYMNGNVGIGTNAPGSLLHLAGPNITTTNTSLMMTRHLGAGAEAGSSIFHYLHSGVTDDMMVFGVTGDGGATGLPNQLSHAKMVITAGGGVGIGTSDPVTRLDVAGAIRISMDSATCTISYAGALRYNAGSLEMCNGTAWSAFGLASAGLNSLNGSTSATQTFANSLTGTTPAFASLNGVHTLNIPLASAGSVTAGLISNADYVTFSNKITSSAASVAQALGYVPASATALNNYLLRSNNLSDLTSSASARTNLGLGGFATVSSLDLGSASATGTIALARLPAAANVTSGTQYTKVTVDGYGRVTSGGQISTTDVTTALGYTPVSAAAASQWNTSGTTINYMNGNVGIGTTTPTKALHVVGDLLVERSANTASLEANGANDTDLAALRLVRRRSDATAPAAGFGVSTHYILEGSVDNVEIFAGQTGVIWEQTQTNATTARDSAMYFATMSDNSRTEKLRITSAGNVGIGTTVPSTELHIHDGVGSTADFKVTNSTTGASSTDGLTMRMSGSDASFKNYENGFMSFETNNNEKMRILANGNVGIGLTNPGVSLDVSGTVRTTGELISTGANQARFIAGSYGLIHRNDSVNYYMLLTNSGDQYGTWNALRPFSIETATGNTKMNNLFTSAASSSVGIGTTSPNYLLDVNGPALIRGGAAHTQVAPGYGGTFFSFDTGTNTAGLWSVNATTSQFAFYTKTGNTDAGTERMRIAAGGNVGIGTSSPNTTLDVSGALSIREMAAPALAPADQGRIYFDAVLNKFRVSENGGAYSDLATTDAASGTFVNTSGDTMTGTLQITDFGLPGTKNLAIGDDTFFTDVDLVNTIGLYGNQTPTTVNLKLGSSGPTITGLNGNLGIGAASPSTLLQIGTAIYMGEGGSTGSAVVGSDIRFTSAGLMASDSQFEINIDADNSSTNSYFAIGKDSNTTSSTELFRVQENGNVGIGTANPVGKFVVTHDPTIVGAGGSTATFDAPGNTASDYSLFLRSRTGVGTVSNVMVVRGDGNVGIGTTNPNSRLSIQQPNGTANDVLHLRDTVDNIDFVVRYNGADGYEFRSEATGIGQTFLSFIGTTGNVGIGTSAPASRLHLKGNLNSWADGLVLEQAGANGRTYSVASRENGTFLISDETSFTQRFSITASGNVGVGTINPTQKLEVNGSVLASAYLYTSDRRLKKDFTPLEHSLDKLSKLSTVKFNWITPLNKDEESTQIGLIAQDVQKQFPEAVKKDEQGWLRLNYTALISPIIAAIQELSNKWSNDSKVLHATVEKQAREIASVKEENAKVKKENEEIKARLERLEKLMTK